MVLILVPAILVLVFSFYISFRSAASPRRGVLLHVTLPREGAADPRVRELVKGYAQNNARLFLFAAALGTLFLLPVPPSLSIVGLSAWMGLIHVLGSLNLAAYSKKLAVLKRSEGWFVGETKLVRPDTIAAGVAEKKAVSRLWFLPPSVIALALFVPGFKGGSLHMPIYAAIGPAAYMLAWHFSVRAGGISVRARTLAWVGLANAHGVIVLLAAVLLRHADIITSSLIVFFLDAFFLSAAVIWTSGMIRRSQEHILSEAGPAITVDQDHYWHGGFYNNPDDSRVVVEKRVGYGATINFGTRKGKIVGGVVFSGAAILLISLLFILIAFDTAEYSLQITGEQITVEAPFYGISFASRELKSVAVLEHLPSGMRTNGAETSRYSLGNYVLQGYGKSKLYIHKGKPPYLVMELGHLHVFFNGKTAEQTKEYYADLQALLGR